MELFPKYRPPMLATAVENLAQAGEKERGAIHTKPEVVELILDLVGYTSEKNLSHYSLLEPSFGNGEFLVEVVRRLLHSHRKHIGHSDRLKDDLLGAIKAVELHTASYHEARERIKSVMTEYGVSVADTEDLLDIWLINDDFLLADLPDHNDFVVGNPPYVRQEAIPEELIGEYRRLFNTLYDRADLYVPFIEKSMRLLKKGGLLGFICSDRWIKNKYGGPLRDYITANHWLKYYIDMVDMPAFAGDVSAYPGIFVISASERGSTKVARKVPAESFDYNSLVRELTNGNGHSRKLTYELSEIGQGKQPWLLDSPAELELLRRIESQYPKIEEAGCAVGIGVASGSDRVFIGQYEGLDVEDERKIPIVLSRDIKTGHLCWSGNYILNPFNSDSTLANLEEYPRFAAYLEEHETAIKARNVARKNPDRWYRTIDRIYPELQGTPKLTSVAG